jgi:hypothetical protein
MSGEEMIRPLDAARTLYAIHDEKGNVIGTGTREVCEILLYIIGKPPSGSISGRIQSPIERRSNVRSAIAL